MHDAAACPVESQLLLPALLHAELSSVQQGFPHEREKTFDSSMHKSCKRALRAFKSCG
jgi:hypothetical protein